MDIHPDQVLLITRGLIVLVMSIAVHEFGHAFVADRLGDDTPRRQGRVTLNPVAHADPLGTLILPVVSMLHAAQTGGFIGAGFGWGKPVETNDRNFTRKLRMTTGMLLVALAGPLMNLLFGTFIALVHVILLKAGVLADSPRLNEALFFAVGLNYTLLFFNLLPIPPLDGGWVLQHFTPYRYRRHLEKYQLYSPFVFMAVILIPQVARVFTVPANFLLEHVYSLLFTVFGMR